MTPRDLLRAWLEADKWQLISTAPRDGTLIEVADLETGLGPFVMAWDPKNECWATAPMVVWSADGPTHWRPYRKALEADTRAYLEMDDVAND